MEPASGVHDTLDDAREAQLRKLRAMSPSERLRLADALSRDVEQLARLGIQRDHPDATERDVLWHLANRRYGSALATEAFGPLPR